MDVWQQAADILEQVDIEGDALHQRFTSIQIFRTNLSMMSARKKKNANSNRYGNVLPFDHNCIKVMAHAAEGTRGQYINASLITARLPQASPAHVRALVVTLTAWRALPVALAAMRKRLPP